MAEKQSDNRGPVRWLWYFRTYAEHLVATSEKTAHYYDVERLTRYYLDGCLDSAILWDFYDWLGMHGYEKGG